MVVLLVVVKKKYEWKFEWENPGLNCKKLSASMTRLGFSTRLPLRFYIHDLFYSDLFHHYTQPDY